MVEETIDLDELNSHNFVLKASFDVELEQIKISIIETRDGMDAEHRRVGDALGIDIDKKLHLENHQVHRYSFRITKAVSALTVMPTDAHRRRRLASSETKRDTLIWQLKSLVQSLRR